MQPRERERKGGNVLKRIQGTRRKENQDALTWWSQGEGISETAVKFPEPKTVFSATAEHQGPGGSLGIT